ncbi:unnamed protein product [Oppiella nova]|uniref:Methyltransferase type 11 domain-containing protein n=1 Tax=Oppiella nova TaxID=334625 RepID=A0A7R9LX36_9ACAR|nr:unnamed protein product [Oppiella nova]CAG2167153.1 unnamed protein product [Oppiella nova]
MENREKEDKLKYLEELVQPRPPEETRVWYEKWAEDYDKDVKFMEYNGPELAINEFVNLKLPKNCRILDIGTGTGTVGHLLKLNGYTNIDGLDQTKEMLEMAKQKKCYTNFITSVVTKDTRLPIEDNTYDAVVMAGCLCPGHIRWNSFPQIIRVVKKGGLVFWVVAVSKAFEDRDEDFRNGNNEKLVESLVSERKWDFIPGYPKTVENYLFIEMENREKEDKLKYLTELVQPRPPEETRVWYEKWAEDYDKDVKFMEYNGPELAINEFVNLKLPKNCRILDIGTGTGTVGHLLKLNGYTNIDGLDQTKEMLEMAKQKKCYTNFITSVVTKDTRLPIEDNTYDAVVMAGCLCPGHIRWNSFPQIIRVVKKGGLVFWVVAVSKAFEDRDEDFRNGNNEKLVESLVSERKWDFIPGYPKTVENYLVGSNGNIYAMKVL